MIDLALFLKRNGYRPDQVQDFIPAPFDVATCVYYTGIDPFTKQEAYVALGLRDRKKQRALMQFFKPALHRIGPGGSCGTMGGVRGRRKRIGLSRRHVGTSGDPFVSALVTGNEWVPVPSGIALQRPISRQNCVFIYVYFTVTQRLNRANQCPKTSVFPNRLNGYGK